MIHTLTWFVVDAIICDTLVSKGSLSLMIWTSQNELVRGRWLQAWNALASIIGTINHPTVESACPRGLAYHRTYEGQLMCSWRIYMVPVYFGLLTKTNHTDKTDHTNHFRAGEQWSVLLKGNQIQWRGLYSQWTLDNKSTSLHRERTWTSSSTKKAPLNKIEVLLNLLLRGKDSNLITIWIDLKSYSIQTKHLFTWTGFEPLLSTKKPI